MSSQPLTAELLRVAGRRPRRDGSFGRRLRPRPAPRAAHRGHARRLSGEVGEGRQGMIEPATGARAKGPRCRGRGRRRRRGRPDARRGEGLSPDGRRLPAVAPEGTRRGGHPGRASRPSARGDPVAGARRRQWLRFLASRIPGALRALVRRGSRDRADLAAALSGRRAPRRPGESSRGLAGRRAHAAVDGDDQPALRPERRSGLGRGARRLALRRVGPRRRTGGRSRSRGRRRGPERVRRRRRGFGRGAPGGGCARLPAPRARVGGRRSRRRRSRVTPCISGWEISARGPSWIRESSCPAPACLSARR